MENRDPINPIDDEPIDFEDEEYEDETESEDIGEEIETDE